MVTFIGAVLSLKSRTFIHPMACPAMDAGGMDCAATSDDNSITSEPTPNEALMVSLLFGYSTSSWYFVVTLSRIS